MCYKNQQKSEKDFKCKACGEKTVEHSKRMCKICYGKDNYQAKTAIAKNSRSIAKEQAAKDFQCKACGEKTVKFYKRMCKSCYKKHLSS